MLNHPSLTDLSDVESGGRKSNSRLRSREKCSSASKEDQHNESFQRNEETDPKRLAGKISMLRKRLKMLECERENSNQLENIKYLLDKEKEQNEYLRQKIEESSLEKAKFFAEWSSLKSELDRVSEQKKIISQSQDASVLSSEEILNSVLEKGFICYICTLAPAELVDSLVLTPRRGYEDGVYKKRAVKVDSDLRTIAWKAVGLFTAKYFTLSINDVCTVIDGTEDPDRFEPFSNFKYISIVSKGLTVMMGIENYYGMYLDGIKELYLTVNSLPKGNEEINNLQVLRLASEQLQNQILTYTRMYKRYKNSMIESICTINVGAESLQTFLGNEMQQLKALSENLPIGVMAADAECYLRNEKKVLVERINALNSYILQHRNR